VATPVTNGRALGLHEILALVADDLVKVEELFEEHCRSDVALVAEIGRYIQKGGGKRVRPALLLLACRLCGYRGDRSVVLAGAVEFIHTATLLHDDIIDEATTRRGRRSVNNTWGNDITVLLGDFLYTKSMAMSLAQDNLDILRLLCDVTLRMVEGELLEIQHDADLDVTEAEHIEIIRRKTADLFAGCTRIGALLADAPEAQREALGRYGLALGICFQMVDDLLDFTADEQVLGKPVLSDLREGKLTLPAVLLMQRGGEAARALVQAVVEDRGFERVRPADLVRAARECGALDEARRLAEAKAEEARRALDAFEPSVYRDALESLPDFILARDH
jgi:octaprenyl-diphosphate synthase